MKHALLLLALAGSVAAGEGWVLLAVRDAPRHDPDAAPPRTTITVDVLSRTRRLATRRITFHDPAVRELLFDAPFVAPSGADYGALLVADGEGLRCLRFSWRTGEQLGHGFAVACGAPGTWLARPVHVVPERLAVLTPDALLGFDLRLGGVVRTRLGARPLQLDPAANRLYATGAGGGLAAWPLLAAEPPAALTDAPDPLFAFPDGLRPRVAFVAPEQDAVAYVSRHRSRDAARFVLSVADARRRLLVRRSVPGRFRDLRWLDRERLLFTSTDGAVASVHTLAVRDDRLTTRRLPARYLAPPEIVARALLPFLDES